MRYSRHLTLVVPLLSAGLAFGVMEAPRASGSVTAVSFKRADHVANPPKPEKRGRPGDPYVVAYDMGYRRGHSDGRSACVTRYRRARGGTVATFRGRAREGYLDGFAAGCAAERHG